MRLRIVLAGLPLLLSACEGGGDPVEQALREASAAHQAAATPTTAEAEARQAAPADQAYVEAAIEEHRATIARAEASLRETSDPALRQLAQTTIDTRKAEIAALQAWRPASTSSE